MASTTRKKTAISTNPVGVMARHSSSMRVPRAAHWTSPAPPLPLSIAVGLTARLEPLRLQQGPEQIDQYPQTHDPSQDVLQHQVPTFLGAGGYSRLQNAAYPNDSPKNTSTIAMSIRSSTLSLPRRGYVRSTGPAGVAGRRPGRRAGPCTAPRPAP